VEYFTEEREDKNLSQYLNEMGSKGWEIAGITKVRNQWPKKMSRYIFKRTKTEHPGIGIDDYINSVAMLHHVLKLWHAPYLNHE